jgi:hypothetical protein
MNIMNRPNKDKASIDAPDTPPNEQNEGIIQTTPDIEQMREETDKEMN